MNKIKLTLFLSSVLLMVACEHKEILKGKRENFFTTTDSTEVDKTLSNAEVNIPTASMTTSHTEVGGNVFHNSINYKLNQNLKTQWKTSVGAGIGTDIISYNKHLYMVNGNGELICIEEKSGNLLWKTSISQSRDRIAFVGGINISNGKLVITTNRGEIITIDLKTKKELLRKEIKLPIKSNPIIVGNKIIVTTIDNKTLAFSDNSKNKLWEKIGLQEETVMEGAGTPAVYGNNIICAYTNGDIASIQTQTGIDLWEDTLFSGDTAGSGFVISHIVASPVIYKGRVLACTSESKTTLIDASSGVRIWEKNIGTINTPVIAEDWIFILTTEGAVKCLSITDGSVKWIQTLSNKQRLFGPLLINGDVIIFSENGEMISLSINNGSQKAIKNLETTISRTPIIVNSSMYLANDRSDVLCLR